MCVYSEMFNVFDVEYLYNVMSFDYRELIKINE